MKLADYLTSENMKPLHLAQIVGVKASTISRILKGERDPSFKLMAKIEDATGGAVSPDDFMDPARHRPEKSGAAA